MSAKPVQSQPLPQPGDVDTDDTTCPRCGESHELAKVKGCLNCLKYGYKFDRNGW